MKRKSPDQKSFDLHPPKKSKDLSSVDSVWAAIYAARCDDFTFLNQLLETPHFFENLDWNYSVSDEKHPRHGISLAWAASHLALMNKPELLNELIKSPDNFINVEWNSRPAYKDDLFSGASLAWMAVYLAFHEKSFLLERMLSLPKQILLTINWQLSPINQQFPYFGMSTISLAGMLGLQGHHRLLNKLTTLLDFVNINWNFSALHEKNPMYGMSLACMAEELASKGYPLLLEKLLTLPTTVFRSMDWNAGPLNTQHPQSGISLAWKAAYLALRGNPSLLNKIHELSNQELIQLDWNSQPLGPQHLEYGVSLACLVTDLAGKDSKQATLLNRLAKLPKKSLIKINWNTATAHTENDFCGETLMWKIAFMAYRTTNNNPALFQILAKLPPPVLTHLNWEAKPQSECSLYYNVSLTLLASRMALEGKPILLDKLIKYKTEISHADWNLRPLHEGNIYNGISLAMMAVLLSHHGNFSLLAELVKLPREIFEKIDWNAKVLNPDHPSSYGISLAWSTTFLAKNGKPALLNKLLELSDEVLCRIDWNSAPLDSKHHYYGASLACLAFDLAYNDEKNNGLYNRLVTLPDTIMTTLDWNACPQNPDNQAYCETLAWQVAFASCYGESTLGALLQRLIALPKPILCKINWKITPLHDRNRYYGASMAWIAVRSALSGDRSLLNKLGELINDISYSIDWNYVSKGYKDPYAGTSFAWMVARLGHVVQYPEGCPLLPKLIDSSIETLSQINWNSSSRNKDDQFYGASLAWLCVSLFYSGNARLLNKFTQLPGDVLGQIDWDSRPLDEKNVFYNQSLASKATHLALEMDESLLNRLLQLPSSILTKINWNSSAGNSNAVWYGTTIARESTHLARKGKPALMNKLFTTPEILEKIDWNVVGRCGDFLLPISTISAVFALIGQSVINNEDEIIENLITDKTVLNFSWTLEAVSRIFYLIFNKYKQHQQTFLKCDLALAQLSLETLKSLSINFQKQIYQNLIDYFGFLINIKSQPPKNMSDSKTFSDKHPVRASTGYWMMAESQLSPSSKIDYYKKIAPVHPFYADSRYILARLHNSNSLETKEIECVESKKARLDKAFEFACHWAHHNISAKNAEKVAFIKTIVAEICIDEGQEMHSKIEKLVLNLQQHETIEVPYLIKNFMQELEISRLQKQLEIVQSQWHSKKSSIPSSVIEFRP